MFGVSATDFVTTENKTTEFFPIYSLKNPYVLLSLPSVDKGRHGFDGQKYAHTASSPLEIRQVFPAGLSLSGHISARQNCFAPASDGFPSDFWLLSRRRAGARQGEKGKKRRKGALAGVFAIVNRWYLRLTRTHTLFGSENRR